MPHASAPGARLYYESTGTGAPIVFVHETCADLRSWEAQVRWFSRSYRCITFNARGYPQSERGTDPASHDYRQLSADIGHVMDAAGVDRAFVVGLSMGAYVTAHFALSFPQRCLGIVLAGLGAGSDDPESFRRGTLATAQSLPRDGMGAMVRQLSHGPGRIQLHNKDRRGWEEFIAQLGEQDPQAMADLLRSFHCTRPPIYEFERELQALKVPTLVAVGDEDEPCLQPALFLKRTISTSGLWVCPRSGHPINLEEPALFNSTVQSFIHNVQQGGWGERDPRSLGHHAVAAPEAEA